MINIRIILANLLVLFTLVLCFVWPIPNHQIHFHRNILIYFVILVSVGLFFDSSIIKQNLNLSKINFVFIIVALLTIFILLNGLFVTQNTIEMISTWNGQWLRPVLLFFSGILILPVIQFYFPSMSAARFFTLVIFFFWIIIFIHLLDIFWLYLNNSVLHWNGTRIVYNRTCMSFQVNMITNFLLAELSSRILLHQRFLCLNILSLIGMLFCNVICTTLLSTRWGTIGLVGNLFSNFIIIFLCRRRHNLFFIVKSALLVTIVISAIVGYISWNTDPRWYSLKNDAIIGWSAPFNSFCYIKTGVIPINNLGHQINHSNGCRASFFHQGWKLISKHPAGIGPCKEAFRNILRHDTNDNRIVVPHSHYGLIEFGIQNGIFGIIGWLSLIASYWYIGWRELNNGNTIVGIFLLLFTVSFFSRTMVDHNLKDHFIEQYMFLTGILIGICALHTNSLKLRSFTTVS